MFYSHEILTSPEHGVATIWLVATLGSRSMTKKLNKKAILDVDVPRACDVIINPEAPMALRLQGSLLYGVSRVYSQQCGYTLTDVQAMHDKMRAMLKVLPGGGLDPTAGKTKPDQLILPDDPSFIPEINLPSLGIDLTKLTFEPDEAGDKTRHSSFLFFQTPDISQTLPASLNLDLNLDLSSESNGMGGDLGGFGSHAGSGVSGSVQRQAPQLGRISASALDDEAGVLLQPDFEFDEDGNIIELDRPEQQQHENGVGERVGGRVMSETPLPGNARGENDLSWDYQPMLVDDDGERNIPAMTPNIRSRPRLPSDIAPEGDQPENENTNEVVANQQSRRVPRAVPIDNQTALRNTELAKINNEYIQNMAAVIKQKMQNKAPAQAKRNAAFWVFGMGIGSVGVGLGASRTPHPLGVFSGEDLFDALHPGSKDRKKGSKKRGRAADDEGADSEGRRVRARAESEEQIGRGDQGLDTDMQDIEIGRQAPSSALRDDHLHSSQMPWNITASIQSSRHGSSVLRGFGAGGSVSDFSSHGMSDAASLQLPGFRRPRSRLTSASPLAGRGFPFDLDSLNGLGPLEEDNLVYGDFDLSHYLQAEGDDAGDAVASTPAQAKKAGGGMISAGNSQFQPHLTQDQLLQSSLDQESVNFLNFMYAQMLDLPQPSQPHTETTGSSSPQHHHHELSAGMKEITFSTLLPAKATSATVATHALMHILTLATKGFVEVAQDEYVDESSEEVGTVYSLGEIHVRLP